MAREFTTTEAAMALCVSTARIHQFIQDGRLTAIKRDGRNFIPSTDVATLLRDRVIASNKENARRLAARRELTKLREETT